MPFYIRNLFSFRKTMAAVNAPPVPRPNKTKRTASVNASPVARPNKTRISISVNASPVARPNKPRISASVNTSPVRQANAPPVTRPYKPRMSASVNTSPVRQTRPVDIQSPRQKQTSSRTHENHRSKSHKSIFSRIVSPFKAMRERKRIRNQNKTQIKTIREEIENNMPDLKISMPLKLQNLVKETGKQKISDAYTTNFPSLKRTFTDEDLLTVPSDSIVTMANNTSHNIKGSREKFYSQHLIAFCGDDKTQASTLSALLTSKTVSIINQQLRKYSQELSGKSETGIKDVAMDLHMMAETARIVIMQGFDAPGVRHAINVKTTIDVPLQNPSFIILDSVDITSALR